MYRQARMNIEPVELQYMSLFSAICEVSFPSVFIFEIDCSGCLCYPVNDGIPSPPR